MSNKLILKKIGAWSLSKINTVIVGMSGFFFGIILFIFKGSSFASSLVPLPYLISSNSLWAGIIVLLTIFYAIIGLVAGLLTAFIYNYVIVKLFGGLELHFESSKS